MRKLKELWQTIVIVWGTHEPRTRWGQNRMARRVRGASSHDIVRALEESMKGWKNVVEGKE